MIKSLIQDIFDAIKDTERDITERIFLLLSLVCELALLIFGAVAVITGKSESEVIVIVITLLLMPAFTFTCMYRKRLKFAIRFFAAVLILLLLPVMFFFEGGAGGDGALWIIFAFIYVAMLLSGRWRRAMMILLLIVTAGCYLTEYLHPEYIAERSRGLFLADSFVSLILTGFIFFGLIRTLRRLFAEENERSEKEAQRARELNLSQNRFFSSMSHEIRTPIHSILGLNELILRDTEASDEVVKDATGIQGAGRMLLALINDILDFSKIEAGGMDIVPVEYRVGNMLSDIVNMIWLKAHEKGLEFNVNVDPAVPSVLFGDEVRIKQVIVNLLNNAVKYTSDGSVDLHIESRDIDKNTVELSISVSDTGIGIKKESMPYLFDAFKRVDQKKNRYIEGTGLGLSIVKQIVELMGGTISANSVYGEGSIFIAVIRQEVYDHTPVGDLSIRSEQTVKRSAYEAGFTAAEASILIVDDNEMNIEVERKLLAATKLTIDQALSGREALAKTMKKQYDTILMDHLMPEMDGVECLERIRNQAGGMNRNTPVLVLTANAGTENRELYNSAGFDGYLIKPVSGETLENVLLKHLPPEKVVQNYEIMKMREDINASAGYTGKAPVIITTNSVCDLPPSIIRKLHIPIIPAVIRTDNGVFKDGLQMNGEELVRYMEAGGNAVSMTMDEATYTDFFVEQLKNAHNLIHISLISTMSNDYKMACEAAKSFDNVTVVNSGCLSSSTGLLVLIATRLAQQNMSVQDIVSELENIKKRLHCSFIVENTDYLYRKGFVKPFIHKLAKSFNMHPALTFRHDRFGLDGLWMGSTRRAYKKYIHKAFPMDTVPDQEIIFITYVGVPMDTLLWIKEEIGKITYFDNILFQPAAAAISSNCGAGTFGIMYFTKGNKSYNLNGCLDNRQEDDAEIEELQESPDTEETVFAAEPESNVTAENTGIPEAEAAAKEEHAAKEVSDKETQFEQIDGLDVEAAIRNCGSEATFKSVLKLYYEKMDANHEELDTLASEGDLKNYAIKIHALKSSSKLVGALELAERAQLLENAGEEGNTSYINDNHASFMQDYLSYKKTLSEYFGDSDGREDDRPEIDMQALKALYEKLYEATKTADSPVIDSILEEISGYRIPDTEKEKCETLFRCGDEYDYDGILQALEQDT